MRRSNDLRLTRTRRRALAVPFVVTFAAAGAACGASDATVPTGDRPETTDVISNPAEPEPAAVQEEVPVEEVPVEETISNPAEPQPEAEREVTISNPAEPLPAPETIPTGEPIVISNPAPPADG